MAIIGVDHIMCLGESRQCNEEVFKGLGFNLSPYSELTTLGGGNQCILFQSDNDLIANYLEIVTVERPEDLTSGLQGILHGAVGPKMLVLGVEDISEEVDACRAAGQLCQGPMIIERTWQITEDEQVTVKFGVYLPEAEPGSFAVNACQHMSRDHYVRPEWTIHDNGASRMTAIWIVSEYPDAVKAQLARLGDEWMMEHDHIVLRSRPVIVRCMKPDCAQSRFGSSLSPGEHTRIIGVTLAADLSRTRSYFDSALLPYTHTPDGLLISADKAGGIALEFVEDSSTPY